MSESMTPRDQQADVERALVGGMLVNPSTISKARLIVNGHDFQSPNLGRLYAAILRVDADGVSPDSVLVLNAALEAGVCGGDRDQARILIAKAIDGVPKSANVEHYARTVAEGAAEPTEFHMTDLGNAERFARDHRNAARYCHGWNQWLIWDGTCWRPDDMNDAAVKAKSTVREMDAEVACIDDDDRRKRMRGHVAKSESQRSIKAMLEAAQADPKLRVKPDMLNRHPWLLNCANGTLDLKTGELKPHDPGHLLTYCLDVEYDPDADPLEVWVPFLLDIFCGDQSLIDFVQRALGYSLTGDTSEQVFFMLYGDGSNGKSSLVETITRLLGPVLSQTTRFDTFLRRYNDNGAALDIIRMRGARFVTAGEATPGKKLDEATVKQLTGGDRVVGRAHYRMPEEFTPEFKIWLSCNHRPQIADNSHAMWRRVRSIPFNARFEDEDDDKDMKKKLAATLPSILKWIVDGCAMWQEGGLGSCEAVQVATETYRTDEDILAEFMREEVVLDANGECLNKHAYAAYKKWCEARDEKPITNKTFTARMRERDGIDERRTRHGIAWSGIALVTESVTE